MSRLQVGKPYRQKQYKQKEREEKQGRPRSSYSKSDRRGVHQAMDEVKQLQEEVILLQQQSERDQKIIQESQAMNAELMARNATLENRLHNYKIREIVSIGGYLVLGGTLLMLLI